MEQQALIPQVVAIARALHASHHAVHPAQFYMFFTTTLSEYSTGSHKYMFVKTTANYMYM